MQSSNTSRRQVLGGLAVGAGVLTLSRPAFAATTLRWSSVLSPTHPEALMMQRIAEDLTARSNGAITMEVFPGGQLGSTADTIEAAKAGAIAMVSEGPGALGQFAPQISIIEAPYVWRDVDHLIRAMRSPLVEDLNATLVAQAGLRIIGATYNGRRHITTGKLAINSAADMIGFKLRVPPIDVFQAMATAWGARPTPINFNELYVALSQGAVDGQENPLPTIESAKLHEVQKYLILSGHIITPRLIVVNEMIWQGLTAEERDLVTDAVRIGADWQTAEIQSREAALVETLRGAGMTVIEPDLESFRKPVLETVPAQFAELWGADTWNRIQGI